MRTNIYKQLNQKERETIYQLKKRGLTNSDIAQKIDFTLFIMKEIKFVLPEGVKTIMESQIKERLISIANKLGEKDLAEKDPFTALLSVLESIDTDIGKRTSMLRWTLEKAFFNENLEEARQKRRKRAA